MYKRSLRETGKNLLISYACALLVIVMLLPIYKSSYHNARALLERDARAQVSEGFARLIGELSALNTQMFGLRNDRNIVSIASLSDQSRRKYVDMYYYNAYNVRYNQYLLDDCVLDLIIQFRANNVLLTRSRSISDKRAAYGSILAYEDMSYAQWQARLEQNEMFWPAQQVYTVDQGPMECITYNWYNVANPSATVRLSALISTSYIKRILGFSAEQGGFLYLAQPDGQLLLSEGYPLDRALEAGEQENITLADQQYALISLADQTFGLRLAVGVPVSVYAEAVRPVSRTLSAYILLALLAAAAATLIYGYFHFKSITPLLIYLEDNHLMEGGRNLFEQIRSAFHALDATGEALRRDYRRALRQSRSMAFDHALSGLPLDGEERALLMGWSALKGRYAVAALCLLPGKQHRDPAASGAVIKALVEADWPEGFVHPQAAGHWSCLLPEDGQLMEKLSWLGKRLGEELGTPAVIGVSQVQEGLEQLSLAGSQAQRALMAATPDCSPLLYCPRPEAGRSFAPFVQYKNLTEQLQAGNADKVRALLDFFRQPLTSGELDYRQVQGVLFNLESALEAAMDEPEDGAREASWRAGEALPTQARLFRLEQAALALCERLERRRQRGADGRITKILSYIDEHYSDPELCLTQIADHFHASESRISQYIKERTGRNYTAHLEERRMREALRLLTETGRSIEEIALMVGYEHKNTFYKSFKRFYGAPPNQVRNG